MRTRTQLVAALAALTLTAIVLPAPSAALPSGWSAPFRLSEAGLGVQDLQVAALPGGGALAVWIGDSPGATSDVHFSVFSPESGWSQPAKATSGSSQGRFLSLCLNRAGTGAAVWLEFGTPSLATASFYRPGTGFTPPQVLNIDPMFGGGSPTCVADEAGVMTAMWTEFNGSAYGKAVSRGTSSSAIWSVPEYLDMGDTESPDMEPGALATNSTGGVLAVWKRTAGAFYRYHSRSYDGAAGWGPLLPLDNAGDLYVVSPRVTLLDDGRAVAAWESFNASAATFGEVTTFSPASGWALPARALVTPDIYGGGFAFACGTAGTCGALWLDASSGTPNFVLATSVDAGLSFSPAVTLAPNLEGTTSGAAVAFASSGGGMVVWSQDPSPPSGLARWHTYAAMIDAQGAVGPEVRLDNLDAQTSMNVWASLSAEGHAVAGWFQTDGATKAAYATVWLPPDTTAPSVRITSPADGSVLNETSAVVSGVVDGGVSVSVNGVLTSVRKDGSFLLRVPLPWGPGTIRAVAIDESGNSASATVNVTVTDPSSALAGQLASANLAIVQLQENLTTIYLQLGSVEGEVAALEANQSAAEAAVAGAQANATSAQSLALQAQSNASSAYTFAWNTQQDLGRTQAELNATRAQITSAQSSASAGTLLGIMGVLAGLGGAGVAMNAIRNMKRAGGGGGGGGGGFTVDRQTPKRDFGDRMKAGMADEGFAINEPGVGRDAASGMPTGKRQHGWQPSKTNVDEAELVGRDAASGMPTGKRQHGPGPVVKEMGDDQGVQRDASSGQATGKRQHGALRADDGIGSQGEDDLSREAAAPRDAASGQATGKRQHGWNPAAGVDEAEVRAPRDAASGQATGKRQHGAVSSDEGIGSQGQDGVSREAASPRDAASGQATGKRQHSPMSPDEGIGSQGEDEVRRAPRDAASGQATGKRQHGALSPDEGIGSQGEDEARRGPRQSTSVDGSIESSVDRDAASRQATGKRDVATGQSSGKRQHGPLRADEGIGSQGQDGVLREATAPRDAASGQATGKTVAPGDPGSGAGSGGIAVNEEGTAERPPPKKPPK